MSCRPCSFVDHVDLYFERFVYRSFRFGARCCLEQALLSVSDLKRIRLKPTSRNCFITTDPPPSVSITHLQPNYRGVLTYSAERLFTRTVGACVRVDPHQIIGGASLHNITPINVRGQLLCPSSDTWHCLTDRSRLTIPQFTRILWTMPTSARPPSSISHQSSAI